MIDTAPAKPGHVRVTPERQLAVRAIALLCMGLTASPFVSLLDVLVVRKAEVHVFEPLNSASSLGYLGYLPEWLKELGLSVLGYHGGSKHMMLAAAFLLAAAIFFGRARQISTAIGRHLP